MGRNRAAPKPLRKKRKITLFSLVVLRESKSNNNTGNLLLYPLNSSLGAKIKKTTIKEINDAAVKFLPLVFAVALEFFPRLLSHHGQFPLSFTSAVFPAQFLYLSQGTHSLGIHWNSLNIISNIWQSLWNVNEMKNQIYFESRSGPVVSEGRCCLGRT